MSHHKKMRSFWVMSIVIALAILLRHQTQNPNVPIQSAHRDHSRVSTVEKTGTTTSPANPRPPKNSLTVDEPSLPSPSPRIHDFDGAKTQLKKLFSRGREFYCNCSYDFTRTPMVDPSSCGLVSKSPRAKRIEWEHVVPASYFGKQFVEWRKGDVSCTGRATRGRECARRASPAFRQIESDMYNLVPAVGELNRARGDSSYGIIPGEPREFGACDFETFSKITEPRPEIRGDIARIYFYMDVRYPQFQIVNSMNQNMLEEWAEADPIDQAEATRLQKIEDIQGNSFFIGRLAKLAQGGKNMTQRH